MWEYSIYNRGTNQQDIIFGYDLADAFRRAGLDGRQWNVTIATYVD